MTIMEISALAIAVASLVIAVTTVVGLRSLRRLRRRLEATSAHANRTLVRVNGIATNLDGIVRDARQLETRVHDTVGRLLDEVEPPLRLVSALLAGTRTGLTAWMRSSHNGTLRRDRMESRTEPQKGGSN